MRHVYSPCRSHVQRVACSERPDHGIGWIEPVVVFFALELLMDTVTGGWLLRAAFASIVAVRNFQGDRLSGKYRSLKNGDRHREDPEPVPVVQPVNSALAVARKPEGVVT